MDPPAQPAAPACLPGPRFVARFARFAVAGSLGVIVNLGLLWVLVERGHLHYALASVVAIEASILHNFAINSRWTWRDGDRGVHTFLNFQLVSLVGMALQWTVLTTSVALLGAHYLVGAAAGVGVATAWNFSANQWFTFAAKSVEAVRRHRVAWMYAAALGLQLLAAALLVHSWDGFVFRRTVENLVLGGESPYATAEQAPAYVYANAQVPPFAQWYAYPPMAFLLQSLTYGPYVLAGASNQILARLLVKLPLVAAALALPPIARRFALASSARPENASRLERILLFSPLLLVIGAAWGQTEVLLGLLLVGSLHFLHRAQPTASAILFGLACVVKVFPLFVYPILLAYLWGRSGFRSALRHALVSGATALAVSAPFLAQSPRGFLDLVFLMHYRRPSSGFSAWMLPEWAVDQIAGAAAREALSAALSVLTLSTFALFLVSQSVRAYRHDARIEDVVRRLGLAFLAFLLVGKVVHEQYLGLAVILLATGALVGARPDGRLWSATRLLAGAAVIATLARGLQFILLVPPDEARLVFGATGPELVDAVRRWTRLPTGGLDFATQTIGSVALIVAAARFAPLWHRVREAATDVTGWLRRIPVPVPRWTSRKAYAVAAAAALVLVPSAALGVLFPPAASEPLPAPAPLGHQVVGAYYDVSWRNPSNDPEQRFGDWRFATTTPVSGFYSSRTGIFQAAVESMQKAGVDFALVPLQARDAPAVRAFAFEAERQGFQFSVLYDLDLARSPDDRGPSTSGEAGDPHPLRPATFDEIRRYLQRPDSALGSEHLLRISDRPVVFLEGFERIQYQASRAEDEDIARHIVDSYDSDLLTSLYGSKDWADEPVLLAPRNAPNQSESAQLAALWESAQMDIRCKGWTSALEPLRERAPNLTFVVDASWGAESCFPEEAIAGRFQSWPQVRRGAQNPTAPIRFETVFPAYNATLLRATDEVLPLWGPRGLSYADRWSEHAAEPFVLLYAWNAHQEGAALEPTLEYGDLLFGATRRWIAHGERLRGAALYDVP